MVIRLELLACLLNHLLQVIETLGGQGRALRLLGNPVDTIMAQGTFSSQVIEAVAELEHELMWERSKAGLRAVRAPGQVGGNPGLLAGDPDALRQLWAAREATAKSRLPLVRRHRPDIA